MQVESTTVKNLFQKAKDRSVQEQWLQALLDSLATPPTTRISTGPMQLRYSLDNLPTAGAEVKTTTKNICIAQNQLIVSLLL